MTDTASVALPNNQVTASELVRQFGLWQERAVRDPVYIMHRGRPKLALLSIDTLQAVCDRADAADAGSGDHAGSIIDGLDEAVLLIDTTGAITRTNRAARVRFAGVRTGAQITDLSRSAGSFLVHAVQRVLTSSTSETLQLASDVHPTRELVIAVSAISGGCMLVARDATAAEEWQESVAANVALAEAIEAGGTAATFRLNPRGQLIEPRRALAALVGANVTQLAGIRLLALIAVGSRPGLAQLVDRVFTVGSAGSIEVDLIVGGEATRKAVIGLAGANARGRIEEAHGTLSLA